MKINAATSNAIPLRTGMICAVFAALIAIGAFIRVHLPVVPFTMQLPLVCLAGLVIGPRRGALAAALYLAIGLIGIPVFANGGGPAYVLQPSFGYLLGFIPAAALAGLIAQKSGASYLRLAIACAAGILVIYTVGIAYYMLLAKMVLHVPLDYEKIFATFFLSTIAGDLISTVGVVLTAYRLRPIADRYL